jgi:cell division protein FtsW (lipid II flippase)
LAYKYNDIVSTAIRSQVTWTFLGVALMLLFMLIVRDHRKIRAFTWTSMIVGLVLIILPLFPGLGNDVNGAKVWVSLGPLGSFQPAEFSKVLFAIFFAGYLTQNSERLNLKLAGKKILGFRLPTIQDFLPIFLVWLVSILVLVLQHDLGTSLLFFGIFIAQLYIATSKASWAILGLIMFAGGAVIAYYLFSHVQARVAIWLNPMSEALYNKDIGGSGQLVQGFFALANGGLFGVGWGNGYPILTPYSNSDFIYTALGEELGLTGMMAILVLYLLIIERGLSTSLKCRDGFGKLLAAGVAFSLALQIFVVVGGVTRVIPMTGLTLPFIARGGSSLVANYLMIGLLIVISNDANKPVDNSAIRISRDQLAPLLESNETQNSETQNLRTKTFRNVSDFAPSGIGEVPLFRNPEFDRVGEL